MVTLRSYWESWDPDETRRQDLSAVAARLPVILKISYMIINLLNTFIGFTMIYHGIHGSQWSNRVQRPNGDPASKNL